MQLTQDQLRFVNREGQRTWLCSDYREGKTTIGAWLLARHILRDYPSWYVGHKFEKPITALCVGPTLQVVRDVMQPAIQDAFKMDFAEAERVMYAGIPRLQESIRIYGSRIDFKSVEQGREKFMGCLWDFIWMDECRLPDDLPNTMWGSFKALTETPRF